MLASVLQAASPPKGALEAAPRGRDLLKLVIAELNIWLLVLYSR